MVAHHHSEEIAVRQQNWETEIVDPLLKRYPERQEQFTTRPISN